MVYKIIGNFEDDFYLVLCKLEKNFKIIYINEIIYIGLIDYKSFSESKKIAKRALSGYDYYMEEINLKNLEKQSEYVQDWARNIIKDIQYKIYEEEQQDSLKQTWEIISIMERELEKKVKGGE